MLLSCKWSILSLNVFLVTTQQQITKDGATRLRYRYTGFTFEFTDSDVTHARDGDLQVARLFFYFRFRAQPRHQPRNMSVFVKVTATDQVGKELYSFDTQTQTRLVNTSRASVWQRVSVACANLDVTSWFNEIVREHGAPLSVELEVEKICSLGDSACRRMQMDSPFAMVTLHSLEPHCRLR